MTSDWVDTHAHFWDGDLIRQGWNPPAPLDRTHSPKAWARETNSLPMAGCIFVESGARPAELALLEAWAARYPAVLGFIAPVAVDVSNAAAVLDRWEGTPEFRGVRAHFQDTGADFLASPSLPQRLRLIAEADRLFEFLVVADQLPYVHRLCLGVPELRVVIEHMGKPRIEGPVDHDWRAAMQALAADTNAVVKVSLSPRPDEFDDLVRRYPAGFPSEGVRRHTDVLLDLFGPDRLVWGSDWPVSHLTAPTPIFLAEWDGVLGSLAARLGETARRVYRLSDSRKRNV